MVYLLAINTYFGGERCMQRKGWVGGGKKLSNLLISDKVVKITFLTGNSTEESGGL